MSSHRTIFVSVWGLTFGLSVVALVRSSHFRMTASNLPAVALLSATSGSVQARGEDALGWAQVDKGDSLHDGDSVATGDRSSAKLKFPDGRSLDLGPGTLLELRSKGTGASREYLVSLLKGLVVVAKAAPSRTGDGAASKVKIVAGSKEFHLNNAKADVALETKSRTREAAVLYASQEIAVRDLKQGSAAPVMIAPVKTVAKIGDLLPKAAAAEPANLPTLKTVAVVTEPIKAASDPATQPAPPAPAVKPAVEPAKVAPKVAPKPKAEPVETLRVVYPPAGAMLWVLSAKAQIPVRIDAPAKSAGLVDMSRAGGGKERRLAFARGRTEAAFAASEILTRGSTAQVRAGEVSFSMRALDDMVGAVSLELDNLTERTPGERGYIVEKPLARKPAAHMIRLADGRDLRGLSALLEGATGFRIAKATGLAEKGAFLVRKGKVVAEASGNDDELRDWCKRLGCELIFRGRRPALAPQAAIDGAFDGLTKGYVVFKDTLIPLNGRFVQQYAEVRNYLRTKGSLVFTEAVTIVKK